MVVAPQFSTVMDDNDDDEGTDVVVLKQLFVIAQITRRDGNKIVYSLHQKRNFMPLDSSACFW